MTKKQIFLVALIFFKVLLSPAISNAQTDDCPAELLNERSGKCGTGVSLGSYSSTNDEANFVELTLKKLCPKAEFRFRADIQTQSDYEYIDPKTHKPSVGWNEKNVCGKPTWAEIEKRLTGVRLEYQRKHCLMPRSSSLFGGGSKLTAHDEAQCLSLYLDQNSVQGKCRPRMTFPGSIKWFLDIDPLNDTPIDMLCRLGVLTKDKTSEYGVRAGIYADASLGRTIWISPTAIDPSVVFRNKRTIGSILLGYNNANEPTNCNKPLMLPVASGTQGFSPEFNLSPQGISFGLGDPSATKKPKEAPVGLSFCSLFGRLLESDRLIELEGNAGTTVLPQNWPDGMIRYFNDQINILISPVRIFNQPFKLTITFSSYPGLLARRLMGESTNMVEYKYYENDQESLLHLPLKVSKVHLELLEQGPIRNDVMARITDAFQAKIGHYFIPEESGSSETVTLETTDENLVGRIGAQDPAPGTVIACDKPIAVYTYRKGGPQQVEQECTVPDLTGIDMFNARSIVGGQGFHQPDGDINLHNRGSEYSAGKTAELWSSQVPPKPPLNFSLEDPDGRQSKNTTFTDGVTLVSIDEARGLIEYVFWDATFENKLNQSWDKYVRTLTTELLDTTSQGALEDLF